MNYLESISQASEDILRDSAILKSRLGIEVLFGGITGRTIKTGLTNEVEYTGSS